MESYDTLTQAISALKAQGYTEDFNLTPNCLECHNGNTQVLHDEFHIDKQFRFDDNEDPSDQAVLYAISSSKHELKGILINSVGIYTDPATNELLKKLSSSLK
jgi:hypothetical protein